MHAAGTPLRVTAPVLDLAASPGGGVVSQVLCGQAVKATGASEAGFVGVSAPWGGGDGEAETGWCEAAGLAAGPTPSPDRWVVTPEALAYAAPTRRAGGPSERLALGTALVARPAGTDRNGFARTRIRGRDLWIQDEDLSPHPPAAATQASRLAVAESLLGRPYIWGGCTSLGLDCSGLVKLMAGLAGVGLPHSAAAQAADPIPGLARVAALADAAKGDFVYLGPPGGRADHVVCWSGEGRVVHASAEGGAPAVRSERWSVVQRRGGVVAVRRIATPVTSSA